MDTERPPETLLEAVVYFANPDRALAFMVEMRWPDGVACPTCGERGATFLSSRRLWKCKKDHARRQFSVKVGTIFEDSPIGLEKWLPALWMIANCKNGISSYELARDLKVTQKTAWFMLHRIRLAMQTESFKKLGGFGSIVEIDETFIGGAVRKMNAKRRGKIRPGGGGPTMGGKAIVMGMLERGGRVKLRQVPNTRRTTLLKGFNQEVAIGTEVHTDEHLAYAGIAKPWYAHKMVNHMETYVDGTVHTNGIENFWSLLKRTIKGTYVSVEPFHLFRYLDEQSFRFNNRKTTDRRRFLGVVAGILGKRLTYQALIGLNPAVSTT